MPRTPKLDKSVEEAAITKVTRSGRRAGSVDPEIGYSRTPLKSHLESISETGSIDSLTPRRSTRRSIAPPDLGTPSKKSQLTKENLARLEHLEDSIENSPSAGKRITRRTSITSEDAPDVKNPFIRLVRSKLTTQTEEIKKPAAKRGRPKRIETPTKTEDKLKSPIKFRRTSSKSPSSSEHNLKTKQAEHSPARISEVISQNTRSSSDATPGSNTYKNTINQTSTPNAIEIVASSDESDSPDDSGSARDSDGQYYRNTSLKKFTGTSKNFGPESKLTIIENKLSEEITSLNNSFEKSTESNDQILSNIEMESQTQDNTVESSVITKQISCDKEVEDLPATDVAGPTDRNTLDKSMDTPIKEITKTPMSPRKSPKNDLTTPVKLANPSKDTSAKIETPAKQGTSSKIATPAKLITPAKLATPIKSLDAVPSEGISPIKPRSPFKKPTPVKINSPLKPIEKLSTAGQHSPDKVDTPEDTNITKFPATQITSELPNNSNATNNLSHDAEVADTGSIKEDDNCVQPPLDVTCQLDSMSHTSLSSASSTDDLDNNENKSSDESFADTFEHFTENIVLRKAKSCSPQKSKNFAQSQISSTSFSGFRNIETKLEFDKSINSKISAATFLNKGSLIEFDEDNHDERESVTEIELSRAEVVSTKVRRPSSSSFFETKREHFEEDGNMSEMESVKQNLSKSETGSAKKINRLSLSNSGAGLRLSVSASDPFIEADNEMEVERDNVSMIELGSDKKVNSRRSSLVASGKFLETDITENVLPHNKGIELGSDKKAKRRSSLAASGKFLETDIVEDVLSSNKGLDSDFVTKRKNKSPAKQLVIDDNDGSEAATLPSAPIEKLVDNDQNKSPKEIELNNTKIKKQKKTPLKSVTCEKQEISLEVIQAKCDEILKERELARKVLRDQFAKKKGKKQKKERKRSPSAVVVETKPTHSLKPTMLPNIEPKSKTCSTEGTKRKLQVESTNSESSAVKKIKRTTSEKTQSEGKRGIPDLIQNQLDEYAKSRRLPESVLTQLEDKPVNSAVLKKMKLPKFEERELTPEYRPSGFKESPITPKILSNKFRVSSAEKESTPEILPSGFKVLPVTPKILSDNFRVALVPKQKIAKRKLKFKEPSNVLSQPVWTSAGFFEETDLGQDTRKKVGNYSTTNFLVEAIGGDSDMEAGYCKADKHRKAELKEFKQKNLFRSGVPRAEAKHVLKSKGFEKANIKFISK